MPDREEDKDRIRRQLSRDAINLAMESRWEEAAALNRSIIESFPTDIDAYNRLGRALTELGELAQAKEAYSKALELSPQNAIAKKNLSRLSFLLETSETAKGGPHKVVPQLFIGEMGKSGLVNLHNLAPKEILAKMAAGEEVYLKVRRRLLVVENERGEYLGEVDPKHGLRLAKLIEGGNRYSAAIASLTESGAKVIIREVFQHPSQAGRLSFPVKAVEGFRPYIRESLLRYGEAEEEEVWEEGEYPAEEEGELLPEGFSIVEEAPISEEVMEEETEEE